MSTQIPVYNWLMENPGEHTVSEIANGTGLSNIQAGNACNNLKKKGAVGNNGNNGYNTMWFALPGADLGPMRGETAKSTQKLVYDWLMSNPGGHRAADIGERIGLTTTQTSNALTQLKKKEAVVAGGNSMNTTWAGVAGVDLGARVEPVSTGTRKGMSPGALAKLKFEKVLEAFIDAAVEIKDFIVVEDQRQELEELRAFKTQVNEALRKK